MNVEDPSQSDSGFETLVRHRRITARCRLYLSVLCMVFVFASPLPRARHRYPHAWSLYVHVCALPDGSLIAKTSADPEVDDIAAIVAIEVGMHPDGRLMSVGRTLTAAETVVRLAPTRSTLNLVPLRTRIAQALASPRPPEGAEARTPESDAAYAEAISMYGSGTLSRSIAEMPPAKEWIQTIAGAGIVVILAVGLMNRYRSLIYQSDGRDRLFRGRCPHCGYPKGAEGVRCTECGTDYARWSEGIADPPVKGVSTDASPK